MRAVPASRYYTFSSIAILACLVDLATKWFMFDWLGMPGEQRPWWIIHEVFGFHTSLNEGALFGLGQGKTAAFAVLSVAAVVAILYYLFYCGAARDWLLTVALGCVTAGIFGNLYDRLGLPGLRWNYANQWHSVGDPVYAVRDWIQVMFGRWPYPTFNIADSLLVCGALLLVWHAYSDWRRERRHKAAAADRSG
jgi:signal peptidase II